MAAKSLIVLDFTCPCRFKPFGRTPIRFQFWHGVFFSSKKLMTLDKIVTPVKIGVEPV
jgi:hypothetical protein